MATKAKKPAARKPAAKKSAAKKSAAKKPAASKPASRKALASQSEGGRLAMSVSNERKVPKPRSNFCEDHDLLLRSDRTCPISKCRFHKTPMP